MNKTSIFSRSCFLHQVNEVALCGRSNADESYGKNVGPRWETTASPDAQAAGVVATIPRRAARLAAKNGWFAEQSEGGPGSLGNKAVGIGSSHGVMSSPVRIRNWRISRQRTEGTRNDKPGRNRSGWSNRVAG